MLFRTGIPSTRLLTSYINLKLLVFKVTNLRQKKEKRNIPVKAGGRFLALGVKVGCCLSRVQKVTTERAVSVWFVPLAKLLMFWRINFNGSCAQEHYNKASPSPDIST
ncbi:hypothetical protein RRG08_017937 [Elysia crispata]|uniref:Uncharacterized protein n=1 Tax=Elysia crispata TaxID=231223 RepID=A0AAE0Y3F0_9GAST|nr:hypothetical protein RRG08_017937 [Elysia crispata]